MNYPKDSYFLPIGITIPKTSKNCGRVLSDYGIASRMSKCANILSICLTNIIEGKKSVAERATLSSPQNDDSGCFLSNFDLYVNKLKGINVISPIRCTRSSLLKLNKLF